MDNEIPQGDPSMQCLGMPERFNAALMQIFFFTCRTAAESSAAMFPWSHPAEKPGIHGPKSIFQTLSGVTLLMCTLCWRPCLGAGDTGEFLRISPLKFYFYKFNVLYRTAQVSVCGVFFSLNRGSKKTPFHQHVHHWKSFISEPAFRCEQSEQNRLQVKHS